MNNDIVELLTEIRSLLKNIESKLGTQTLTELERWHQNLPRKQYIIFERLLTGKLISYEELISVSNCKTLDSLYVHKFRIQHQMDKDEIGYVIQAKRNGYQLEKI